MTIQHDVKPKNPRFIIAEEFCKHPPKSNYLIRGFLDLDSLSYFFGDSVVGKSFLSIDISCHIANGIDWCGFNTKQGVVLYITNKEKHRIMERVIAWHSYNELPRISKHLYVSTITAKLCNTKSIQALIDDVKNLITELNTKPALIILDTLNYKNSTRGMTLFVNGMNQLRQETGAAISTVHHCGQSDKSRRSGNIILHNAVDFAYNISDYCTNKMVGDINDAYITTMEVTKIRDYDRQPPLSWSWNLKKLPSQFLDDYCAPA